MPQSMTRLDHIILGADTLEQGCDYVQRILGVSVPPGGEHPRMGTHNCVMRLGSDTYFEIIAVNPQAPSPTRPRWFGLDDPFVRAQLKREPRLLTWVVASSDLAGLQFGSSVPLGTAEPMSRGSLKWLITIPPDGSLPGGGVIPALIQWQSQHPAANLSDLGCRLLALEIWHPYPQWLTTVLTAIDAVQHITIRESPRAAPRLVARFQTPAGEKKLESGSD